MPRRPRKTLDDLRPKSRARNARLPQAERDRRLAARTAVPKGGPFLIPVTKLYAWIAGAILLPACWITARTLVVSLGDSIGGAFWRTPAFWFFGMGFLMWLIWFLWLPRPVRVYVWGHEMTHALMVILCGGKIREFKVTAAGGHILTDRNNVLIALAPYFVPLYSVLTIIAFLITGLFADLTLQVPLPWNGSVRPLYGLFWLLGATWSFHVTFTIWMIARNQPDLRINGTFFSLTFIILINLLIVALLLILASPQVSVAGFFHRWADYGWNLVHSFWTALRTLCGGM